MATRHDHSTSMNRPVQLYQPGLGRILHPPPPSSPAVFGGLCDSTVVTTTSSSSTSSAATQLAGIDQGKVAKPARRRSRASRRAPTTLLNTDTTNFRAMVQQFTGIPSSAPYYPGGGVGSSAPMNPMMMPAFGQNPFGQQDQYLQYHDRVADHQHPFQYSSINSKHTATTSGNDDDAFLLGFNNSCANYLEATDGFYFDGTPTHEMILSRPTSTNTTRSTTDGFFS